MVRISFEKKEATFIYSSLFRSPKVVPLKDFSRVYVTPFYEGGGFSIHLVNKRGKHLLLARVAFNNIFPVDSGFGKFLNKQAQEICDAIADGLGINNGY